MQERGERHTTDGAGSPQPGRPDHREYQWDQEREHPTEEELAIPGPVPHPEQPAALVEQVDGREPAEHGDRDQRQVAQQRPAPVDETSGGQAHRAPHQPTPDGRCAEIGHRVAEDPVGLRLVDPGGPVPVGPARLAERRREGVVEEGGGKVGPRAGNQPREELGDAGQVGTERGRVAGDDDRIVLVSPVPVGDPPGDEPLLGPVAPDPLELHDDLASGTVLRVEETAALCRHRHAGQYRAVAVGPESPR